MVQSSLHRAAHGDPTPDLIVAFERHWRRLPLVLCDLLRQGELDGVNDPSSLREGQFQTLGLNLCQTHNRMVLAANIKFRHNMYFEAFPELFNLLLRKTCDFCLLCDRNLLLIHLLQYTFVDELTRVAVFLLGIGRLKLKGLAIVQWNLATHLEAFLQFGLSNDLVDQHRDDVREICGALFQAALPGHLHLGRFRQLQFAPFEGQGQLGILNFRAILLVEVKLLWFGHMDNVMDVDIFQATNGIIGCPEVAV
mmetsp:Transcript_53939/g.118151  ORF Transcript_53939/g.118151 Transcript_53939/m.118151 type:complete len:252 (-) Transcript_53939:638-1393(-)